MVGHRAGPRLYRIYRTTARCGRGRSNETISSLARAACRGRSAPLPPVLGRTGVPRTDGLPEGAQAGAVFPPLTATVAVHCSGGGRRPTHFLSRGSSGESGKSGEWLLK